jgi:hypothetical protein
LSWTPPHPSLAPRPTQLAAADLLPLGHAAASLFLLRAIDALFLLSRVVDTSQTYL